MRMKCPGCDGKGTVDLTAEDFIFATGDPLSVELDGDDDCPDCDGTGWVEAGEPT